MFKSNIARRPLRVGLLLLVGCLILLTLFVWNTTDGLGGKLSRLQTVQQGTTTELDGITSIVTEHRAPNIDVPSYCNVLNISNIAIIVKTGATEVTERLPPQLSTFLRCVADPLIFSDLDQTLSGYQVHDVLSRFTSEAMKDNPDFEIYFKQKDLAAQGRWEEIKELGKLPSLVDDWRTKGHNQAWALDKYKFLHMIARVWEYQRDKDWYVFIEGDTYLSLANLERFLAMQDSREKLYFGNGVTMWEDPLQLLFAHGGSGFILSGAAVKEFAESRGGLANSFDFRIRHSWYGDFVVAEALNEMLRLKLTDILPMMQGDSPAEVPFGEHSWCKPAISLHHMSPSDFSHVFEYEKTENFSGMLYKDLFAITFDKAFPLWMDDWENSSDNAKFEIAVPREDIEEVPNSTTEDMANANDSFEACERGCVQRPDCFQFSYHAFANGNNTCHLSSVFRGGRAIGLYDLEPGKSIRSGWLGDRIAKWVEEHQHCPG